ncbi:YdcF family protein [Clostridium sp. LP20]|uniref:YdcF family protein n=1 Tax=Clostridium sp. LP20 TaxID=3418665 RepID=UPI003EE72AB6
MKRLIDLIIGVFFIGYFIVINLLSSRKIAFSGAIAIAGVILILYHFLKKKFEDNRSFIKANKLIRILVCIGLVGFLAVEAVIIGYPKKSEVNTDYILVLGAGLNNGNELSLTLKDRLDAALKCINEYGNDGYIVLSGGKGSDERISESEAMKRYLLEQGLPSEKIITEDKSTNTYENFKYSKDKIEEHSKKPIGESSVKVVTTDFHGFRSSILANRNGYEDVKLYTSNTVSYLIPVFYAREALALVKSVLFDR